MRLFNKLCAVLVSLHFAIYLAIGLLVGLFLFGLDIISTRADQWYFLENIAIPAGVYLCLQHYFCSYFYQEKYEILCPRNPFSTMSIGIPSIDKSFYETISSDIHSSRRIAGYIYAFAKPIVFTILGMVFVCLFIVMTSN